MTKYGDFWVKVPKRLHTALRRCRTDQLLGRSGGGIDDEFHKSVREYDGSSDDQLREAYVRATEAMAPRLLVPFASMKQTHAANREPLEVVQRHLHRRLPSVRSG